MNEFRTGDPVKGQTCPGCRQYTVVYNGNYFCTHCPWAMPGHHGRHHDRIIKAYLIQRRAEALAKGNAWEVERMDGYLIDYADEVKP